MHRWLRSTVPLALACGGFLTLACSSGNRNDDPGDGPHPHPLNVTVDAATKKLLDGLAWNFDSLPPGYWDEQGIPSTSSNTYVGNMVVFPSPYLANIGDAEFMAAPQLVAVVDLENALSGNNPLGLAAGPNCVFLQEGNGNHWSAAVTSGAGSSCAAPGVPNIPVKDHPEPGKPSSAFPANGRIEIDESSNDVLIGLRCNDRWCNIGTANDQTLPAGIGGGSLGRAIKGRHDRQTLAVFNSGLKTSTIRGTVVPDDDVTARSTTFYADPSKFKQAAIIHIDDPGNNLSTTKYGNPASGPRWKLSAGDNILGFRFDQATGKWHAAIIDGSGNPLWELKVSRTRHPGAPMPATARWLWSSTDEAMWLPCADGCCTVDAI